MTRIPLLKSTFPTKLILDLTGFMPSKLEMYFIPFIPNPMYRDLFKRL